MARPRKVVEEFLSQNGIRYFIVDTLLLRGGKSAGVYIDRFEALKRLWKNFEDQWKPEEEDADKSPHTLHIAASSGEGEG